MPDSEQRVDVPQMQQSNFPGRMEGGGHCLLLHHCSDACLHAASTKSYPVRHQLRPTKRYSDRHQLTAVLPGVQPLQLLTAGQDIRRDASGQLTVSPLSQRVTLYVDNKQEVSMEKDLIEVAVTVIPDCDICADGTKAGYDAKLAVGPWAYLCQHCFEEGTSTRLGMGVAQRLVLKEAGSKA